MKLFFGKISKSKISFYLLLFLLCFIPEAIFLTQHGFFWDDWSQLLIHQKLGDHFFWEYFSYDRPGSAWTHILFFPLCGSSPVKWHFLFLALKYLLTILFWQIFRYLFPDNNYLTKTAAMFFAVCPLFSQEYTAIAYSQHYTDFVLYAFSVYALILAAKGPDRKQQILWFVCSMISMLGHLTVTEYFVFLDLMKLPFLWIIFVNDRKINPLKLALRWFLLPFLVFFAYCLFRLNLKQFFPQYNANTPELVYLLLSSPLKGISALICNASMDLIYTFTGFISKLFAFDIIHILSKREILITVISLFLSALTVLFHDRTNVIAVPNKKNTLKIICTAIPGIVLGILPFWIMNENFVTSGDAPHADRCFLAAMPFFCFALSAMFNVFFQDVSSGKKAAASAILIFLFAHNQMAINLEKADLTRAQNSFYFQLSQRIPGIQDGTAIVDDSVIFPDQGNFATASAINILFPNGLEEGKDIPLWVFTYDTRLYENHGGFSVQKRNYHFNQPPTNYVYIDHDNKFANCTWIFGPEDADNPHVTDLQKGWIKNSNLTRIKLDEELEINEEIFGKTNNNWCGYYQKAGLLRQRQDWEKLAMLADEVLKAGFSPSANSSNSPFEWWPFIEGLYRNGDTEKAMLLADEAISVDNAYTDFFASRLSSLSSESSE